MHLPLHAGGGQSAGSPIAPIAARCPGQGDLAAETSLLLSEQQPHRCPSSALGICEPPPRVTAHSNPLHHLETGSRCLGSGAGCWGGSPLGPPQSPPGLARLPALWGKGQEGLVLTPVQFPRARLQQARNEQETMEAALASGLFLLHHHPWGGGLGTAGRGGGC